MRTAVIFGVPRMSSSMCDAYRSSNFMRGFSMRFGGPSCRRYLRTVLGAGPRSRATDLIGSPSRRQRRRMVSRVFMLINPLGVLSRSLVSLPKPSGGVACFLHLGVQFSPAATGSKTGRRFQYRNRRDRATRPRRKTKGDGAEARGNANLAPDAHFALRAENGLRYATPRPIAQSRTCLASS